MYEEYWNSDEEDEQEKLTQIMRTDFIEDLHKASEIPEVLPAKDQEQISKGRKIESHPQKTLEQLIKEKNSELILFKLPSSLKPVEKVSEGNKKVVPLSQEPQPEAHCLADLPTGSQVGKLQLLRSGRVIMNINKQVLDVTQAIPSQCFETAVRIETTDLNSEEATTSDSNQFIINGLTKFEPGVSSFNNNNNNTNGMSNGPLKNSNSEMSTSNITKKGRNTVQVLGEIPYSFVCSYDYRLRNRTSNKKS